MKKWTAEVVSFLAFVACLIGGVSGAMWAVSGCQPFGEARR